MANIAFTDEGKKAFDRIAATWPPMLTARRIDKFTKLLSMLMAQRGLEAAGTADVVEMGRLVLPRTHEPLFDMLETGVSDGPPQKSTYGSVEDYVSRARFVTRWPSVPFASAKAHRDTRVLASPRKNGNYIDLLRHRKRLLRRKAKAAPSGISQRDTTVLATGSPSTHGLFCLYPLRLIGR